MSTVVGQIQINLGANTVAFQLEMNRAAALAARSTGQIQGTLQKLSSGGFQGATQGAASVGKAFSNMGHGAVTDVQAVSASLRTLEGGLTNNLRAAERFVANAGLGGIAQKLFPLAGGLAFGGVLLELGNKAYGLYETFQKIQSQPARIAAEFGKLNRETELANDELRVSNDRLDIEIAKLSGRPGNGLKLALDEAAVSADRLFESLNKGNQALKDLLEKQGIGKFEGLFFGKATTDDDLKKALIGENGFSGIQAQIDKQGDLFADKIRGIREKVKAGQLSDSGADKSIESARAESNTQLEKLYGDEIRLSNQDLTKRNSLQAQFNQYALLNDRIRKNTATDADRTIFQIMRRGPAPGIQDQSGAIARDEQIRREALDRIDQIELTAYGDMQRKKMDLLKTSAKPEDPIQRAIVEQTGRLAETKAKLDSIGQSPAMRALAEAAAQANKKIAELNEQLQSKPKREVVASDVAKRLTDLYVGAAQNEQKTREKESLLNLGEQIAETQRLTAVQLSGISSTRAAELEKILALKGKATDSPEARAAEAQNIQSRVPTGSITQAEADAQVKLLQVKNRYADATKLRSADQGDTDEVASIQQRIAETRRLIDAQTGGYAAIRAAQLANIDSELAAHLITQDKAKAMKEELTVSEQLSVLQKTTKSTYQEQLETLTRQRDVLTAMGNHQADLKRNALEIKKVLDQQALATGTFSDGIRVAFHDMATGSQSSAQASYAFFNDAFQGINSELIKMIEGQKVTWDGFFRTLAGNAAKFGLDKLESTIAGKIGGALGKSGNDPTKPTGAQSNPFYVMLAGDIPQSWKLPGAPGESTDSHSRIYGWPTSGDDDDSDDDSGGGGIGGFLGKFGGGIASIFEKLFHFAGFFAEGGSIGGGQTSIVGEAGPELFVPRTAGTIIPNKALGGGPTVFYSIDARGADEGSERRFRDALVAVHGDAVKKSVAASAEMAKRRP